MCNTNFQILFQNGAKAIDFEKVTDEELNKDDALVKAVLADLNQIGRDSKLHGFELPKGTSTLRLHLMDHLNNTLFPSV